MIHQQPPQIPTLEPIPETEPVLGSALQVGKTYSRRGRNLGAFIKYVTDPLSVIPSTIQTTVPPSTLSTIIGTTRPSYHFDTIVIYGGPELTFTEVA